MLIIEGDSVRQFSTDNGLVSNMMERLHIAPDGSVWAGSLAGLSHISFEKNGEARIRNFTTEQGLPSNEISEIATFCGQLWVGTAKGLARLGGGLENTVSPPPFSVAVAVGGRRADPATLQNLRFLQNNITVDFRTLNLRMNGRIFYQYRLLPNGLWASTDLTSVNFPKLPPGGYLFGVKSQNEDGIWSLPVSAAFNIAPPWWATFWFRAVAVLGIGAAVYYFFKKRTDALKAVFFTKNHIAELERRAIAAQMSPHFIFNCLTSIQNFIAVGDKENAMRYTDRFAQLTRTVLHFSAKKTIRLDEELHAIEYYLELERLRTGSEMWYEIAVDPGLNRFDTELPPMLIQPFVENSFKHGKISRLELSFAQVGENLVVAVRDDGIGLGGQPKKLHESKGIAMTRERLAHWNGRNDPADLIFEGLEKGILVTLKIKTA